MREICTCSVSGGRRFARGRPCAPPPTRHRGIIRTKTEYRRRRVRREGGGSRRTLSYSARTRHLAGLRVSHGWASVRTSATLGRYSSAIRAACANERSCGSVRGAISDGRPYRDLIIRFWLLRPLDSCWSVSVLVSVGFG